LGYAIAYSMGCVGVYSKLYLYIIWGRVALEMVTIAWHGVDWAFKRERKRDREGRIMGVFVTGLQIYGVRRSACMYAWSAFWERV